MSNRAAPTSTTGGMEACVTQMEALFERLCENLNFCEFKISSNGGEGAQEVARLLERIRSSQTSLRSMTESSKQLEARKTAALERIQRSLTVVDDVRLLAKCARVDDGELDDTSSLAALKAATRQTVQVGAEWRAATTSAAVF